MRKVLISEFATGNGLSVPGSWLDLDQMATAELSSEDPRHPFEQALRFDAKLGWKASEPGPQMIRLRFDSPQTVRRIHLVFHEELVERSQEIALFGTTRRSPRKELIRQQWFFSPSGATTEVEDYFFDLKELEVLELEIDPGRGDQQVFASLQSILLG